MSAHFQPGFDQPITAQLQFLWRLGRIAYGNPYSLRKLGALYQMRWEAYEGHALQMLTDSGYCLDAPEAQQ